MGKKEAMDVRKRASNPWRREPVKQAFSRESFGSEFGVGSLPSTSDFRT
jgi:hypothetical protein